jgi:hypothetical protein
MKNINFINKAKGVHGNKYDYSLVDYKGVNTKVKIICQIHGKFEQTPHHHMYRKQGCNKCGYINISKNTRKKEDVFISEAKLIHGDKYDYSLAEYINAKTKVKIICQIHGKFEQTPTNHLNGQTCGKCNGLNKSTNEFIKQANLVHGDKYDYSLVDYIDSKTKIKITCTTHGEFEQLPTPHLSLKQGCPKCVGMNKTTNDFINDVKLVHGDKYDYSKTVYETSKIKIDIICYKHGLFKQTPNMHLKGQGCPICKESKGEKKVREFLFKNKINFIRQHTFFDCKNTNVLPFDFYLPDHNICIEYDGIQHFKPVNRFGGEKGFLLTKQNDSIKNNYCLVNKINLIRIPYFEDVTFHLKILLLVN